MESLFLQEKHWSNEEETLKLIHKIIHPYLIKKRGEMNLAEDQMALVVWDVLGQMTEKVKDRLAAIDVVLVPVPVNMTHIFQPLDLTVNGSAKSFCDPALQNIMQQLSRNNWAVASNLRRLK